MATTKPVIVLIHGGWHKPTTYEKFTDTLKSAGHEVEVPALPSMNGSRPPNADLNTDTAFIRNHVERLVNTGRTVVAIMHSYGGQVGTNALHGLGANARAGKPGGVAHLIYMCAFALPEGKSMMSKVKEFDHEHLIPLAFDFAEDDTCVNRDPKTLMVGPGASDEEVEKYVSSLERWNGKSMYQDIAHSAAWREIPVTYIYTSQDMTVPFDYQKSMVETMRGEGREVRTVELATGHSPNLTMTKEVVDVVNQVTADLNK